MYMKCLLARGKPPRRGSPAPVFLTLILISDMITKYIALNHLLSLSKYMPRALHVTGRNVLVHSADGVSQEPP